MYSDLTICHLIGQLRYGGAERQFVNILNHLSCRKKYAVLLQKYPNGELRSALNGDVGTFSIDGWRVRYLPYYEMRLARLLRKLRIDVLHTHMFWPSLYGVLAARLASVPVVVTTEHGTNPWKTSIHRWFEREIISSVADLRICVSEEIRQVREGSDGIDKEKLKVIPNGTEVPHGYRRVGRTPLVIGTAGRLVPEKDYTTLVRAANWLQEQGYDFELDIVGDGPERGKLEEAVARFGLQNRVHFQGFQSEMTKWYQHFDVFVLSSIREGQPMVLLEAMATGLPIVATRVGGIPATCHDGKEGILVNPGEPRQLAEAMGELLQDRQKRMAMGESARARIIEEFSIEATCKKYLALYEQLYRRKTNSCG